MRKASFREVESGFLQLPWHPEMEGQGVSSELSLLPMCCQGGGSWEGSYGPEEGSVVGGLWMRQEMTGYRGQWGKARWDTWGAGRGDWESGDTMGTSTERPNTVAQSPITSSLLCSLKLV